MTENSINTQKELKYILRKNSTFEESGLFSVLSPIQVIKIFSNFQEAKQEFYKYLMEFSENFNANGASIEGMSQRELYKRLMFRNIYMNRNNLDSILISKKNTDFIYDIYDYLWTTIKSIEETEYFNLLNPLNIFEILVTTNDYLYAPVYNEEFFKNLKYTINNGLYIDELDFWTSQDCISCEKITNFFGEIDIRNTEIIDINDDKWNDQRKYTIKNNKLTLNNPTAFSLFELNKNLKKPFVIFEKIDIKKTREYEKSICKNMVINTVVNDYCFENTNYFDEYLADIRIINHLCYQTSLTSDLIKEIINENRTEIIKLINDLFNKR